MNTSSHELVSITGAGGNRCFVTCACGWRSDYALFGNPIDSHVIHAKREQSRIISKEPKWRPYDRD